MASGLSAIVLALVGLLALGGARASLTIEVQPHETACFYQDANRVGQRVHFTFAVLSGGAFDIDFVVKDPNAQVLNSGNAEKDGEFLFVVEEVGEYSFCFSNAMSTFVTKTLSFDILMAGDAKPVVKKPAQPAASPDLTPIQDSINAAREGLSKIERQLQYYRTRERRNFDTVYQTESRVFWTTVIECVLMIGVAVVQVFVVRSFFSAKGKQRA